MIRGVSPIQTIVSVSNLIEHLRTCLTQAPSQAMMNNPSGKFSPQMLVFK